MSTCGIHPHLLVSRKWHVNKKQSSKCRDSLLVCCKSGWALGSTDLVCVNRFRFLRTTSLLLTQVGREVFEGCEPSAKCTKHTLLGLLLEVEMSKKCTQLWRKAHFEVKMCKAHHCRTTFGSWDVRKVHAVVAQSTFRSQNVQSTPLSDHFWKLRCQKSAGRCGAKHISKSKCPKHTIVGPLLEVEMSKKCTWLWREAHFQVKMYKAPRSDHFWTLRCRKSDAVVAKHISKSKVQKTAGYGELLDV